MQDPNVAARHLLLLCELLPDHELTRDDLDFLFRRLVEDADPELSKEAICSPAVTESP